MEQDAVARLLESAYSNTAADTLECFGCGKLFSLENLKACGTCMGAYYCGQDCQMIDWRKPRNHKCRCMPALVESAMNHPRRLPRDFEGHLRSNGQFHLIPNSHINQTLCRVICPDLGVFIEGMMEEYEELLFMCTLPVHEALETPGDVFDGFVDRREYGFDLGVQSICLALNLWPGIRTTSSCSGIHSDMTERSNMLVQYMARDADSLQKVQSIIERGVLGVELNVLPASPSCDAIGGTSGLATVDCDLGPGKPNVCRAWCREVWLPKEPSNEIDRKLSAISPFLRNQANLFGYVALSIELVFENPSLNLDDEAMLLLKDYAVKSAEQREMFLRKYC